MENKKIHINFETDDYVINKEYTKEDIKYINLTDNNFKDITKDDEPGQYIYIIYQYDKILPDLFIKPFSDAQFALNTNYSIEYFSEDI